MGIEQHIDLNRYPVDSLDEAPTGALVERCRAGLEECGAYVLGGFLRPPALDSILTELGGVVDNAYYRPKTHNVYLAPPDTSLPADHPRNREQLTSSATLAYDFIGAGSLLDQIYRWAPLRAFIARTLGCEELHPYDDPLAAVNVLVYPSGTRTGWHFDNAHFVVTIMLQQGEGGGVYEYAPFIRGPDEDNYPSIEAVLDGDAGPVRQLEQRPGDLVVFQGRYTLHRVTEVVGALPRLVAVLSYDVTPGMSLTPHTRSTFYGRAHPDDPLPRREGAAD